MKIHKTTKLTSYHKQEIWHLYHKEEITVTDLAKRFGQSPDHLSHTKESSLKAFCPFSQ
ncbi:hypothetical protein [Gilliamella sp. App6-5]|uniref:hypothetical protein n=1 Tax=Gilliamella sp. App6-5 TaxID=3120232 RepID=UPI00159EC4F1|nr:hypothetical protein [Gilliamella apicola]